MATVTHERLVGCQGGWHPTAQTGRPEPSRMVKDSAFTSRFRSRCEATPLPRASAAAVAKTVPLPCVPAAAVAKTAPSLAALRLQRLRRQRLELQ